MTFLILLAIIATLAAVLAIVVVLHRSFTIYPFHSTLRSAVGLLSLVAGNLVLPALDAKVTVHLGIIDGEVLSISSGNTLHVMFGLLCITAVIVICLIRMNPRY